MPEKITFYYSSVSGNLQIKKNQLQIQSVLESKKVPFDLVDVAADATAKEHMKSISGKALVPQIFVDDKFKGGYEEFYAANEDGKLNEFFGLDGVF